MTSHASSRAPPRRKGSNKEAAELGLDIWIRGEFCSCVSSPPGHSLHSEDSAPSHNPPASCFNPAGLSHMEGWQRTEVSVGRLWSQRAGRWTELQHLRGSEQLKLVWPPLRLRWTTKPRERQRPGSWRVWDPQAAVSRYFCSLFFCSGSGGGGSSSCCEGTWQAW